MQKLSTLRSLHWFRSLAGSGSKAMKAAKTKPSSDAGGRTYGSFANLKITGEKLVKEQASVNTDPEMAHTKLRRATEQINLLDGKLQQAVNEKGKLNVKQTEDSKIWQGLDSKVSSTKTLCDQLTETLQQLASLTARAEEGKMLFDEKLGKDSTSLDEFNCLLHDLSTKLESAEQTIISGKHQIMLQIKREKDEMDQSYKDRLCANDMTIKEKDSLIKQLEGSVDESKAHLIRLESRLQCMEQELKLNDDVCISLKENLASAEGENILKLESDNQELVGKLQLITDEKSNNAEFLQGEIAKRDQQVDTLESQVNQLRGILDEKEQLYSCSVEIEKTLEEQKLQVEESHAAAECQLIEAKNCDLMLEGKQIELSKHLKELPLKNDEAINDICKKYELEKISSEKQKAEKHIWEMDNKCNEKISENKKDSESYLMYLKEKHGIMVARILQDNEYKKSTLRAYHKEELQRVQSQSENELTERLSLLRKEHELQMKSLWIQHEEECQRLQELLELQKSKFQARLKESYEKKVSNIARVKLDPDNWHASGRRLKQAIRKAQAWCRAYGHYVDLSDHLGQGVEVCTTPPDGTFHMTFECKDRELTIYLDGRTLYVKGWRGKEFGMFEIQSEGDKGKYIPDPSCKIILIGVNYNELCKSGGVKTVRTGPEAIMNFFDVLFKCDGTVSGAVAEAIAGFAVNVAEPIRNAEVLKLVITAFDKYDPEYQRLGCELAFWVRKYDYYSKKIMEAINCLDSGMPVPVITDLRDKSIVLPLHKLLSMYPVLLRDALNTGKFLQKEKHRAPAFSPATGEDDNMSAEEVVDDEEEETEEEDASPISKKYHGRTAASK